MIWSFWIALTIETTLLWNCNGDYRIPWYCTECTLVWEYILCRKSLKLRNRFNLPRSEISNRGQRSSCYPPLEALSAGTFARLVYQCQTLYPNQDQASVRVHRVHDYLNYTRWYAYASRDLYQSRHWIQNHCQYPSQNNEETGVCAFG